jgi:hypothetical protein
MPIISASSFMLAPICSPIRISISLAMMAGPRLLVPQKSSLGMLQTLSTAATSRSGSTAQTGSPLVLAARFDLPVSPKGAAGPFKRVS